jgi:hypothetical protein
VTAARHADADDQGEEQQEVREPDDREVGSELGVLAGGHVEDDHAGHEEDQEQRPDQLCDIRGETSILHFEVTSW